MCFYRYKVILAYDGYDYQGFQAQEGAKTIEGELNIAFKKWLKEDIKIVGSGRTDKEVHANGQVIHFDLKNKIEPLGVKRALNSFLPIDIRIKDAVIVDNDFHARFSAKQKEYRYKINYKEEDVFSYRYAPYIPNLDLDAMIAASKLFIGTHNFKGFCSAEIDPRKDCNKTIFDIKASIDEKYIVFSFIGNGFLKYQVRRMMGILIDIGQHKCDQSKIQLVLEKKDPRLSHRVAPGCGLTLYEVKY